MVISKVARLLPFVLLTAAACVYPQYRNDQWLLIEEYDDGEERFDDPKWP
jgi:hypothetical protein